jgi:hypothetical protein
VADTSRKADLLFHIAKREELPAALQDRFGQAAREGRFESGEIPEALLQDLQKAAESGKVRSRRLKKGEARVIVARERGIDPESVRKTQQRHRRRQEPVSKWSFPFDEPCTCEHFHCAGGCNPALPEWPCVVAFSVNIPPSEWPEGHKPGTVKCKRAHRHCQVCGIAVHEGHPYIFPDNRFDPETCKQRFLGWYCRDHGPPKFE